MISTVSWCESEDFHLLDYVTRPRLSLMFFSANKTRVHSFEPLTNLAAYTQCSLDFVKFIVNIFEQTTNFFSLTKVLFWTSYFFTRSHAWNWGCGLYTSAANTRVFTVCWGQWRSVHGKKSLPRSSFFGVSTLSWIYLVVLLATAPR